MDENDCDGWWTKGGSANTKRVYNVEKFDKRFKLWLENENLWI